MEQLIVYVFPALLLLWLFVMGATLGSFLNVCIYRLQRGKNLLWPSSRCGACLVPIPLSRNIPLLSWWALRGRCASCGAAFSMRYFWVEFLTAVVLAGLYYLEVCRNIHGLPLWRDPLGDYLYWGRFPPHSWGLAVFHSLLAALLIVAGGCLLEGSLPRPVVVTGMLGGLLFALLYPWPEPLPPYPLPAGADRVGFMPLPVWQPLPDWLPPASLPLGLATAAAGILGPAWLVRLSSPRAWFKKRLGPTPGLLALTGGFLGWQPLLVALSGATILTALAALPLRRLGRSPRRAFDLVLLACLAGAWLGWRWLASLVTPWLFNSGWLAGSLAGLLLVLDFILPASDPPAAG